MAETLPNVSTCLKQAEATGKKQKPFSECRMHKLLYTFRLYAYSKIPLLRPLENKTA